MERSFIRLSPSTTTRSTLGILILGATLAFTQTRFSEHKNDGASGSEKTNQEVRQSSSLAATLLFSDDFNSGALDPNKWHLGGNAGNQSGVANNALELRSQGSESGWVITRNAYPVRNTTITVKVTQPNDDGDLGISPTYSLSSLHGIYNEPNWYRFYTYREDNGPYHLYIEARKNGVLNGIDVTGTSVINGAVYLRLRIDNSNIHFEMSFDGVSWTEKHNEPFSLPGYTLDNTYYYELAAYRTESRGVLVVDDLSIASQSETLALISPNGGESWLVGSNQTITWSVLGSMTNVKLEFSSNGGTSWSTIVATTPNDGSHSWTVPNTASSQCLVRVSDEVDGDPADVSDGQFAISSDVTVLSDPLNGNTSGARTGGSFVGGGGWQVVGDDNMIVYDLGRYIDNGSFEVDIRNFDPSIQSSAQRQHFLAMFRNPWGTHHPAEELETVWDLHAGVRYADGIKVLSWTYQENEVSTLLPDSLWNLNRTYRVKVTWQGNQMRYYRNGVLHATHNHSAPMQLRYLFIGRDLTVSGDLITNYKNNQYPAVIGPIYSNVVVKRASGADTTPPQVSNVTPLALYTNAARIGWNTNESSTCRVEYGLTTGYGNSTVVLGPPATAHETTLAGLAANQTYHFRVIAQDAEGNTTITTNHTFTTLTGGNYVFLPTADTFVEADGIYGPTRSYGNFGWMHLLLSDGRECYLRFNVTGISGNITAAALRLHGRQTGGGGTVHVLGSGWSESETTWLTKPDISGSTVGNLPAITAGQWSEVSALSALNGNGTYNFALTSSSTQVASLDSRESPNFQPELIIQTTGGDQTPPIISNVAASNLTSSSATITWTTNEASDSQVEYGLNINYGSSSPLNGNLVTSHSVALSGLTANTTYHYRVKSRDAAGNLATSGDFTFTTQGNSQVALYEIHQITLMAANAGLNPYVNGPAVSVTFTGTSGNAQGKSFAVKGFWDGGNTYRVRFAPTATGTWSWSSSSGDAGLNGKSGTLTCSGALPPAHASAHGHVHESSTFPYTFQYNDGTPFFIMGDTQWSFSTDAISWPGEFQTYVDARSAQGFNYVHGQIYPLYPPGNDRNEGGQAFLSNDVDQLNPGFWQMFDQRLAYLNQKGIVGGLLLAWSNEGWQQFSTQQQVDRFLQYVASRYAAYNLIWITAGEYEEGTPPGGHSHVGEFLQSIDPYAHPITTHTINTSADDFGNAAWHTTIYQQLGDPLQITLDRHYNKPVINAEFGYEGDQSAENVRKDAWEIVMRGGFLVYGDTATFHYHAQMTQDKLYSPGAAFMTILKNFWTNNGQYVIEWWRFTRFQDLGNFRWLAGQPGVEYVVYVDNTSAFTINLSEASGVINGQWFNTMTGQWGATFSGNASASFSLTPPGLGYAAYMKVGAGPSPTLTLLSPNGGESWTAGSTQNITWSSTGTLPNVKLEFSVNNGANWTTIIASTVNDGSHSWTIPNNVSTQCLVRVSDAADGNPADVSDAVFEIIALAPTLTLISPNGGESWTIGSTQNITWSSTGTLSNVRLEISVDNGANWTTIIASTANDGSHSWTIPNNVSNQCLVRVSDTADGNPADASDAVFAIVAPAPTISSFTPTGGPAGTEVTIIGTNFTGATSVAFNGMNATSFTVDSGTQIRATVPSGATTGKISVTTPAGTGVSANDFVVAAASIFNPTDDAYVRSDQTNSNFGSATTLRMKQSSPTTNSYLKFVVSGLNDAVQSAKLRMKVTAASSSGGSVYTVSNNYRTNQTPWVQSGLNYNNAPTISGTPLSTIGSVTVNQVVEFDVTSAITGNGTFSFGLRNSSSTTVQYSSKEGATKPELVIQTGPVIPKLSINDVTVTEGNSGTVNATFAVSMSAASTQVVTVAFATANGTATAGDDYVAGSDIVTFPIGTTTQPITITVNGDAVLESNETFFVDLSNPANATLADAQGQATITDDDMVTITLTPTDDAYVQSNQANTNYGTATTLRMKRSSPTTNSYLKFLVSGVNGQVLSAKLRMKVTVASSSGGSVYAVSNDYRTAPTPWLETGLNYNNAPSISGTALSTVGSVTVNQVVEFDVTSAISGNGTFSFGLKNSSSTTVRYSSKEGATRPELVIQFGIGTAAKISNLEPPSSELKNEELAAQRPERFALLPNYPNPFNAQTKIVYQLPERAQIKLVLHDLMGREVKLLANEDQEAGTYEVGWDGRDAGGNPLPSGIYIYSLQAGSFRTSKKLLLVK